MAAAVAVLAGTGVGGKFAWDATAVRRECALQSADVDAIVPWAVSTASVDYGTEQYPFVDCSYDSAQTGELRDGVSVFQDSTEQGATPGKPERCLKGGYWQGRGYVCVSFAAGSGITQPPMRSVLAEGIRVLGPKTYSVQVRCAEPGPGTEAPTRGLQERCFNELTALMSAFADKLQIAPDPTTPQEPLSLDAALVPAGLDAAGTQPPAPATAPADPVPSPSDPGQPQSPTSEPVPVAGSATFPNFEVSVTGTQARDDGTTLVQASVCLTSLTADASNGTTRISWEPWSATTQSGAVVEPTTGKNVTDVFPRESRVAPGECVTGSLVFKAVDVVSVSYKNAQGDSATFP